MNKEKHNFDKRQLFPEEREFEEICIRCGACCGAYDGDPCEHLQRDGDGSYFCDDYENRLGIHHTVSGVEMECLPIMEKLREDWIGDHLCAYKNRFTEK